MLNMAKLFILIRKKYTSESQKRLDPLSKSCYTFGDALYCVHTHLEDANAAWLCLMPIYIAIVLEVVEKNALLGAANTLNKVTRWQHPTRTQVRSHVCGACDTFKSPGADF